MLLLLVLAVPPPPSSAYVQIKNQGASQGYARIINCSGSGVTCAVNTTTAEATLTVTTSDAGSGGGSWDGGPAIPACSAGYVLDADGGVLYCINTIANATLAATATALASNPTDCSSGQYANAIAASGNLTCAQVAASQLSGQLSDAQLDGGYSGVGACSAHQWASTLTRNASPTCTQPNYSDLAGCEPGNGVAGAVQYNSSSCEGGISEVTSDSTHLIYTADQSYPPPDAGGLAFDFSLAAGTAGPPQTQLHIEGQFAVPAPVSFLSPAAGSPLLTPDMVHAECHWPDGTQGGSGSMAVVYGTATALTSFGSTQSFGWDAGSAIRKHRWVQKASNGNTVHTWNGLVEASTNSPLVVGLGFVSWQRWATLGWDTKTAQWLFMGWKGTGAAPSGTTMPSSITNTVYFGCDNASGDAALQVCSNDTSGSATCNSVSTWKCRTANERAYDSWFWAAPGEGNIHWLIARYDDSSTTTVSGVITSDLPQTTMQLSWLGASNNGDDAGVSSTYNHGLGGVCEWVAY